MMNNTTRKRPHDGNVPLDLWDPTRMKKRRQTMMNGPETRMTEEKVIQVNPLLAQSRTQQMYANPFAGMPSPYYQIGTTPGFSPVPVQQQMPPAQRVNAPLGYPQQAFPYQQQMLPTQRINAPLGYPQQAFPYQQQMLPTQRINAPLGYPQQAFPYQQQHLPMQAYVPKLSDVSARQNVSSSQYIAEGQKFQKQTHSSHAPTLVQNMKSKYATQQRIKPQTSSPVDKPKLPSVLPPYRDEAHKAAIQFGASHMKESLLRYENTPIEDIIGELRAQETPKAADGEGASSNKTDSASKTPEVEDAHEDVLANIKATGHSAIRIESNIDLQAIAEKEADDFIARFSDPDQQEKFLKAQGLANAGQYALEQAAALCFGQDESFWGESGLVEVPGFGFICRPPTKEEEDMKDMEQRKQERLDLSRIQKEAEKKEQELKDIETQLREKRAAYNEEYWKTMERKKMERKRKRDEEEAPAVKKKKSSSTEYRQPQVAVPEQPSPPANRQPPPMPAPLPTPTRTEAPRPAHLPPSPAPTLQSSAPLARPARRSKNLREEISIAQQELDEFQAQKNASKDKDEKKRLQAKIRARTKKIENLEAVQAEEDAKQKFIQQQVANQISKGLGYMTPPSDFGGF